MDTNTAVAQIRCKFPSADFPLESLSSDGNGSLSKEGLAQAWGFVVRDLKTSMIVRGSVIETHDMATDGPVAADSCGGNSLTPLDSARVMPDAVTRFAPHQPFEGGTTNYFLFQAIPCRGGSSQILIQRAPNDPSKIQRWVVVYSPPATFEKLCGPCEPGTEFSDNCSPCYSD
jgi:hypothetical protein